MIRWLRQGVLIVLLGVAPLVLLEGCLRLAGWPTERVRSMRKLLNFDEDLWNGGVGVFRPGARARVMWPPELSYEVHVNTLGLRGPEIERTPPPGVTRILALGDSMTFGYYVEEDQTWPARLQALFGAEGAEVEVVNGGSGGWTINSQTLFLIDRALSLEPHQVVIGFYPNDVTDLAIGSTIFEAQKRAVGGWRSRLTQEVYTSASYEFYLRAQVAWTHWRESFEEPEDALRDARPYDGDLEESWAEYATWLDRMHEVLLDRGTPLVIAYIPDVFGIAEPGPTEDETRLRRMAEERGIPFVSARPDFEAQDDPLSLYHLPLDSHINAAGADRVARTLFREMPLP